MLKPRELLTMAREAMDLWLSRNAFQHAGALAFFTLFSMAPLLIILTTQMEILEEGEHGQLERVKAVD